MNFFQVRANAQKLANEILAKEGLQSVPVVFSAKMTRTMGIAYYRPMRIHLSKKLWERASEKQRRNTIVHEVCHIIVFQRHNMRRPSRPHGYEWKSYMRKYGETPNRCHSVKVNIKKQARRTVYCDCGEKKITKNRYTRMVKGSLYRCTRCRQTLSFAPKTLRKVAV